MKDTYKFFALRQTNQQVPLVAALQKMSKQKLKFKFNRMRALFRAFCVAL